MGKGAKLIGEAERLNCDQVKQLEWSAPKPKSLAIPAEHIEAESPFGKFTISWRPWRSVPVCLEKTPWGGWHGVYDSIEKAKEAAQEAYCFRVLYCLKMERDDEPKDPS